MLNVLTNAGGVLYGHSFHGGPKEVGSIVSYGTCDKIVLHSDNKDDISVTYNCELAALVRTLEIANAINDVEPDVSIHSGHVELVYEGRAKMTVPYGADGFEDFCKLEIGHGVADSLRCGAAYEYIIADMEQPDSLIYDFPVNPMQTYPHLRLRPY